jgi:thiamine biosynthesis lipoprotein ApbE
MSFSPFETRLNASVLKHMANGRVTLGGADIDIVFENPSAAAGGGLGMVTTAPTAKTLTALLPADPVDATFAHAGMDWRIVGHEPDGTGWSVLTLECAS